MSCNPKTTQYCIIPWSGWLPSIANPPFPQLGKLAYWGYNLDGWLSDRATHPPICWGVIFLCFQFLQFGTLFFTWGKHFLQRKINNKIWTKSPLNQKDLLCSFTVLAIYNILDWFITNCTEKQWISSRAHYEKLLPRLVGESPDQAIDRLNYYTLDQGVIPNRRGVLDWGKVPYWLILSNMF